MKRTRVKLPAALSIVALATVWAAAQQQERAQQAELAQRQQFAQQQMQQPGAQQPRPAGTPGPTAPSTTPPSEPRGFDSGFGPPVFKGDEGRGGGGQGGRGGGRGGGGGGGRGGQQIYYDRAGVPNWPIDQQFKSDVFTFVRVRYTSGNNFDGFGGGGGRGGGFNDWRTDYPDSDFNFSYRLHELTALEVNPDPIYLDLDDEAILHYPFLYLLEPGNMNLTEPEIRGLRRYCLNGGFLMVDDFWGVAEYQRFYRNIKRVFPDREPVELPLEHEIFHCVYDIKWKPQIPAINVWRQGRTTERNDAPEAYFKGIFDDEGRMMVIICHNTDLGDGWEREGEEIGYFQTYSEKWAYPMGINIVVYAMTH